MTANSAAAPCTHGRTGFKEKQSFPRGISAIWWKMTTALHGHITLLCIHSYTHTRTWHCLGSHQENLTCASHNILSVLWKKVRGGLMMNTSCVLPSSSFSLSSGLLLIWSSSLSTGAMIHVVLTGPHSPHTDTAQSCSPLSICPSVSVCSPALPSGRSTCWLQRACMSPLSSILGFLL